MSGAHNNQLKELIEFLRDPRPDIRRAAAQMVEGLAGSADGAQTLSAAGDDLLPALLWLVSDANSIAKSALTSLVNLSQDAGVAAKLLGINVVDRAMDYIKENTTSAPDLLVMLLANVTNVEAGSEQLMQLGRGDLEGFHMGVLLSRFIEPAKSAAGDMFAHVAYILTNVTRLQKGQAVILEPGRGYLDALVSQLSAENPVRRRGCATALRNICFGAQTAGDEAIAAVTKANLRAIVEPLSGVASVAAQDDTTREALAEAVLLLAGTAKGRQALWTINTPELLRKGYEGEEHAGVVAAMERTAELFIAGSGEVEEIGK